MLEVASSMVAVTPSRENRAWLSGAKMETIGMNAWYGNKQALTDINLRFRENEVMAVIGPSGCGKSTFIRCLNRMHELVPDARIEGSITLDGEDIFRSGMDPADLRRRVGMVFQKPNPFPNMSVRDNAVAGLKLAGVRDRRTLNDTARSVLEKVHLWDEVKDDLKRSGASLSGGQQQRLCIARALAVEPEVILMDEPCSALDPIATSKIEQLVVALKETYTVIIVTHNMQQATRVSDRTAFFYLGKLIEVDDTAKLMTNPKEEITERYVTGKFG